ncbi:hypothetical protein DRN58_05235 [Thermococci archaeon]|nr:MAG: hypothetical protein DRN58_05235 [Thermococci archaeon]
MAAKSDLILVDKKMIKQIISEIEERLEELEILTDQDLLDELKKRKSEIKEGKFIDEEELFDFLKKKGAIIE